MCVLGTTAGLAHIAHSTKRPPLSPWSPGPAAHPPTHPPDATSVLSSATARTVPPCGGLIDSGMPYVRSHSRMVRSREPGAARRQSRTGQRHTAGHGRRRAGGQGVSCLLGMPASSPAFCRNRLATAVCPLQLPPTDCTAFCQRRMPAEMLQSNPAHSAGNRGSTVYILPLLAAAAAAYDGGWLVGSQPPATKVAPVSSTPCEGSSLSALTPAL